MYVSILHCIINNCTYKILYFFNIGIQTVSEVMNRFYIRLFTRLCFIIQYNSNRKICFNRSCIYRIIINKTCLYYEKDKKSSYVKIKFETIKVK